MVSQFKVIGIFGRIQSPEIQETVRCLVDFLQSLGQSIVIEEETAQGLSDTKIERVARDSLCKRCNLLIVVGGDGSLLHAAHAIANDEIPVLGINRGRLGFLTDIMPKDLKTIRQILDGQYKLEKRFFLTATVEHQQTILGRANALNEVALIPDSVPHMTEFEIYIDDHFVCSQHSDGVIIATPTGSTAYALSGGGPILHPQLDAIVVVPMFPHTLSIRPIVIEGNKRLTIKISPNNITTPRITCDSQGLIPTPPGSQIHIEKKPQRLHLIHPIDYDYYETLRSKLHWGRKLHYSE